MEAAEIGSWGFGEAPLIIAGPCSAESEEQLLVTARALKATGRVHILEGRALETALTALLLRG